MTLLAGKFTPAAKVEEVVEAKQEKKPEPAPKEEKAEPAGVALAGADLR